MGTGGGQLTGLPRNPLRGQRFQDKLLAGRARAALSKNVMGTDRIPADAAVSAVAVQPAAAAAGATGRAGTARPASYRPSIAFPPMPPFPPLPYNQPPLPPAPPAAPAPPDPRTRSGAPRSKASATPPIDHPEHVGVADLGRVRAHARDQEHVAAHPEARPVPPRRSTIRSTSVLRISAECGRAGNSIGGNGGAGGERRYRRSRWCRRRRRKCQSR